MLPRRLPPLGITGKLAAAFVLFGAALLVAMTWYAYVRGSEGLRAAAVAGLVSVATEKESAVNAWIAAAARDILALAGDPHLPADVAAAMGKGQPALEAHARLVEDLRARTGNGEWFTELLVLEPEQGRVIAATDPDEEGKYRENRPYFVHGRRGPHVQAPYYSLQRRGPALVVSAPLRSPEGRLVAVVAGRLNLDRLQEIVTRRSGLQRTDDAFVVNAEHLVVTRPRFLEDALVLQRGIRTPVVGRCLGGESGTAMTEDYRGIPVFLAFRWMPERGFCLLVKIDQAEALAPVIALRRALLAFGGGALLTASLVAVGLGRAMARPVRRLTEGAARVGRGDLAVRLPETSGDELGALAREFNAMAAALAEREHRLREAADALRESNLELEAFSYSVSHDLRAPLRAMDGFSRILLERHAAALPEEARRYLGMVRDNAVQMGHLVDDLLRFSRLGRQPLEIRSVVMADVVRDVLDNLAEQRRGRQVETRVGDLPACQADPALVRQVLVNLLDNALKFTRGRQVAAIEVGCRQADGARAYFVRDNGAGFDIRYADKLFGVFQRLHRTEEFEGTGVGLAIVQRIVHRHGGRVWAEAAVDRGATFHFTLEGGIPHDG